MDDDLPSAWMPQQSPAAPAAPDQSSLFGRLRRAAGDAQKKAAEKAAEVQRRLALPKPPVQTWDMLQCAVQRAPAPGPGEEETLALALSDSRAQTHRAVSPLVDDVDDDLPPREHVDEDEALAWALRESLQDVDMAPPSSAERAPLALEDVHAREEEELAWALQVDAS